ncbi:MAG: hypothetical protein HKO68_03980, partial [Desulfobacterales bacterium]|nr:hypothetical protein [Desulfobacterales bacterium]
GKKAASINPASVDVIRYEENPDISGKTRSDHRDNSLSRIFSALGQRQQSGGEAVQDNMPVNESTPVSKMIEDAQAAKEKQIKMSTIASDELGSKVSKVDISASDNGLLNSHSQSADKTFETTFSSKATDAGQGTLQNQTLDQIVRRAVIHLRQGQHEAKIDLKPDFLGHIRMQIITENHQVTVKILAEFPFVKDMIENHVHQLKADLQQQGLSVDKLEVSVSRDSDEYRPPQEKTNRLNARQGEADRDNAADPHEKKSAQVGNSAITADGASTVDYFA